MLTFGWLSELIVLGNRKVMEQKDIWGLVDADTSDVLIAKFNAIRADSDISVAWALVALVRPLLFYQWSCAVLTSILAFAGPYFLFQVISYITVAKGNDRYNAIWYLLGLFVSTCVKATIDGQVFPL